MIDSLGFTGSSKNKTPSAKQLDAVKRLVSELSPKHAHHGDCINSDAAFHQIARRAGCIMHGHPPINPKKRAFCEFDVLYTEKEYLKRNKDIVFFSDVLIATPNGYIEQDIGSGTWATIRYARKKGIPIYIVYPNGDVRSE